MSELCKSSSQLSHLSKSIPSNYRYQLTSAKIYPSYSTGLVHNSDLTPLT